MENLNFKVVKILNDVLEINWELPFKFDNNSSSSGTGAFINSNGYILTCAHVVCNSISISVIIPGEGEKPYNVDLIGFCPTLDLALLKIKNYKPKYYFELGDSNILKLGDEIITIGFPGTGDENDNLKITKGIVSGQQYGKIQIDAPISPGNSGGPMIFNNKIVGVNVSSMVSFKIQNMNFSVPINNFKEIRDDLLKLKKCKILYRPSLTIDYNTTNDIMKKNIKKSGVYVNNIYPDSMFKKTGIKIGDILTKINNYRIDNYGYLEKEWFNEKINLKIYFNNKKNNEKVSIEFWSNSKRKYIKKNIIAEPYKYPIRKLYPVFENINYEIIGGLILIDLNINFVMENSYDFKKYLNNENRIEPKIVISNIFKNSYVGRLNIFKKKEIIEKINDINVKNINELKKILEKNKKNFVKIETSNKKVLIISNKDILENDKNLIKLFNIKLSNYHKKIKLS